MSRRSRVLKIVAIDACVLLACIEVLPRVVPIPGLGRDVLDPPVAYTQEQQRNGPHPYLAYAPKPGWSSPEGRAKTASHNRLGFRGPEIDVPKPEGTFRILCLGGSSTYGNGPSSNEATYPVRLEHHLRKAKVRGAEVVNLGAPGWTSTESLINLCLRGAELEPDLVLVYHATNDALAALWPDPEPDLSHFRTPWVHERRSAFERLLEHSQAFLIARAYLTNHRTRGTDQAYYTIIDHDPNYSEPDLDRVIPRRGFETFGRNLRHLVAVARAEGAEVAFVVQAFHPAEGEGAHHASGAVRRRAMLGMLEVQAEVAASLEVPLIDTAAVLEEAARASLEENDNQNVFTNNVHLRNPGANLLGLTLAQELAARGLVPTP